MEHKKHKKHCYCQKCEYERDPSIPMWIVNNIGELGVKVNGKCFFLYKGSSLTSANDGLSYRPVQKREFGESCIPEGHKIEENYTIGEGWETLTRETK